MWHVLRRPSFTIVWIGEVVSVTGDLVYEVAFAWLVLSVTHSAAILAGVLASLAVPRGLLLLVGGAITDRVRPRSVMFWSHVLRGLLISGLFAAVITHSVHDWEFFVVAIAFGIADAFFWPASSSIVPSLVPTTHLPKANALVSLGEQSARLLGPAIGGVLVAAVGPAPAIGIDAVTFFLAAITVLAAPRAEKDRVRGRLSLSETIKEVAGQINSGLAYARRSADTRVILLVVSASTLAYSGLFGVGFPALAKTLPQGSVALGAMVSAWGLGQFLGALSAGFTGLPRRWGPLIIGMAFCEAAAFAAVGIAPDFVLLVVLLAVLGFGTAYSSDVALPTWIQVNTPPEFLGRVNSIINLPRVALEPVSLAIMGALAVQNARFIFLFAAAPLLTAAVVLVANPTARSLSRNRTDTPVSATLGAD
jgi:MFS family permease